MCAKGLNEMTRECGTSNLDHQTIYNAASSFKRNTVTEVYVNTRTICRYSKRYPKLC